MEEKNKLKLKDLVKKPSDIRKKNLKMIIYSKSFVGKSFFATNNPTYKTLVLDLESGTGGLEDRENVDIIPISNVTEFKNVLEMLEKDCPYDLVVVDSFTKYSEMLYAVLTKIYPEKKDSMLLWNTLDLKFRQYYELLLKLDSNVVITALEELYAPEGLPYAIRYPMIKAKKFKEYMPSQADIVAYANVNKDNVRTIYLKPSREYMSKNRFERFFKIDEIKEDDELFSFEKLHKLLLKSFK